MASEPAVKLVQRVSDSVFDDFFAKYRQSRDQDRDTKVVRSTAAAILRPSRQLLALNFETNRSEKNLSAKLFI